MGALPVVIATLHGIHIAPVCFGLHKKPVFVSTRLEFVIRLKTSRTDKIQKMQKELRGSSHEMDFLHKEVFPLTLVNAKLDIIKHFFLFLHYIAVFSIMYRNNIEPQLTE